MQQEQKIVVALPQVTSRSTFALFRKGERIV